MSDSEYTKEKPQRWKWWRRGRVRRSTGRCICTYVSYGLNVVFLFSFVNILFCMFFHRRIDVSPSAFKKHSHLFEDFEESSYKVTQRFQIWNSCPNVYQLKQQKCAMRCIMLMHKSPNLSLVLLSVTLSPSRVCRMINRGYILAQTKWLIKRKWKLILCPSLSLDR